MKKLLILGLLVLGLSSCGQSLDTIEHTDDKGEDVTTETNHNRLEDIQDCLNGDKPACKRAISEGFTNAPLFLEDLADSSDIVIDGLTYSKVHVAEETVVFRNVKRVNNYGGGTRHYNVIIDIEISDDYSVDIVTGYTFEQNGTTSGYYSWGIHNSVFNNEFAFLATSNLEWKSHDSSSIHIETIGNIDVK